MAWRLKSFLIAIAANVVFLVALPFWVISPLMAGLLPAFKVCELFDPGIQPRAGCEGWHGTAAFVVGIFLSIAFDWLLIWAVVAILRPLSRGVSLPAKPLD